MSMVSLWLSQREKHSLKFIKHIDPLKWKGRIDLIAEIKGKISRTGSNLSDKLEDNLTGNVFGALRYIPFNLALRNILSEGVYPLEVGDLFKQIDAEFWSENMEFWPYDVEGEIDVMLHFEKVIVGIEVKYLSGLSSNDDMGITSNADPQVLEDEERKSINQLARESRIVSKRGKDKTKILLFIADSSECREVYDDVIKRKPPIIEKDVLLGYISWQNILEELKNLKLENPFYQIIIEDIISLLIKKKFERFKDMSVSVKGNIMRDGFYKFGATDSFSIDFNSNIKISRGVYYEFS